MAVFDVDEKDFQQRVLDRSREVPVVVDFWADWCGPCRQLTPALEREAAKREGQVELAKVDVDRNQRLAASFRVQGIPAVKAFKDGELADEFTGAIPPALVEEFFDRLVPSQADKLVGAGDEESLRRAVELDPKHAGAATALARLLMARGESDEALRLLEPFELSDFLAAGLLDRAKLAAERDDLQPAFEAWDAGDHEQALERLQEALKTASSEERSLIRGVMVGIFEELGTAHPLAQQHRRRLASVLH
jgi:putative thioredoxin